MVIWLLLSAVFFGVINRNDTNSYLWSITMTNERKLHNRLRSKWMRRRSRMSRKVDSGECCVYWRVVLLQRDRWDDTWPWVPRSQGIPMWMPVTMTVSWKRGWKTEVEYNGSERSLLSLVSTATRTQWRPSLIAPCNFGSGAFCVSAYIAYWLFVGPFPRSLHAVINLIFG